MDTIPQAGPAFTPGLPPVGLRGPRHTVPGKPPRKRRRVFLWIFLALQVLFLFMFALQVSGGSDVHSNAVAYCHAHPDQFLPFAQCVSSYGGGAKAGTAIGAGLIFVTWAVVDIILGISYGVWKLARR